MIPFRYERPANVDSAVALVAADSLAQFIAGGTSQVDLRKEGVQKPSMLVDVSRLPLGEITLLPTGGLLVGANMTNAALAQRAEIQERYAAISEAILAGASHQIRNAATTAGNLLQRTRCPYLRHPDQACNKRVPGSDCAAVIGYNRMHAIFGATDEGAQSPHTCIAVHPSDLAVALCAHDAVVLTQGPGGGRRIPLEDLLRLPEDTPHVDSNLRQGELVTGVELPPSAGVSHYLKVRDRASYAYALASCAVAVVLEDGRMKNARIVLGSVAAKPWRCFGAEQMLEGEQPDLELIRRVAAQAVSGAHTYAMNAYKVELAEVLVTRALAEVSGIESLQGERGTVFASSVGGMAGACPVRAASGR